MSWRNFKTKPYQNMFWAGGLSLCLALPLLAQTAQTSPERLAILDLSGKVLARKQSQAFVQALAQVCQQETPYALVSETSLAAYLKKRHDFSPAIADSALVFCQNLALDYVIVFAVEKVAAAENSWQLTLRWLDGASGQMTKIYSQECAGDLHQPHVFPLRELLQNLLQSPEIIVPVESVSLDASLLDEPAPEIIAAAPDSLMVQEANLILPPPTQMPRRRSWLWYVTGAALVSGGSAAFLLKNSTKATTSGKTLLPEPPDPPK